MLAFILVSRTIVSFLASLFCKSSVILQVITLKRRLISIYTSYREVKEDLNGYTKTNAISIEALDSPCYKTTLCKLPNCDLYIEAISENFNANINFTTPLTLSLPDTPIVAKYMPSISVTEFAIQGEITTNLKVADFLKLTLLSRLPMLSKGLQLLRMISVKQSSSLRFSMEYSFHS